jgi:hypothetical protein
MAVRANYFPLWEMEDGKFRITIPVNNPRPIQEYLSIVPKFSRSNEGDIIEFQKMVNDRHNMIRSLVEVTTK